MLIFKTKNIPILENELMDSTGPAVIGYAVAVTLPSILFFDSLFSSIVIISYVIVTAKLIK